jgi:hypothetical protein
VNPPIAAVRVGAGFFQPPGEPLVQLRPVGLGQRLVGGVADQQMPEPERVSPGSTARSGRTRSLWTNVIKRPGMSRSSGAITCTEPWWNDWPSTDPHSSTVRSAGAS